MQRRKKSKRRKIKKNIDTEILAGFHSVYEAVRSGRRTVVEMWLEQGRYHDLEKIACERRVATHFISSGELKGLATTDKHQGVVARVSRFEYSDLDDVVEKAISDPRGAFIIVLDQIQDPQNLGAVIRTAHCCGAHGLILPKDNAAQVSPVVCRASAGATEYLPILQVTNLVRAINTLKSKNIWVYAMDAAAPQSLYAHDFQGHHAIVFGGEGKGLRRLAKENCDATLSIPMKGRIDSFNISAAAAIVMGEVLRQRHGKNR